MNLQEIDDKLSAIRAELATLEDNDAATEDDSGDLVDTLMAEFDTLSERRKPLALRMQKLNLIKLAADDPANTEPGADDGTAAGTAYRGGSPDLVRQLNRDPYEDLEAVADGMVRPSDLISRAHNAIELENKHSNLAHDFAENCTRMLQNNGGRDQRGIAQHMLLTGSQEYQDAFRAFLAHPDALPSQQKDLLSRTALALSGVGSMLPFVLDPTIILTNTGSANPWRRISNVKQTTSNTWNGVTSAGVSAQWLTEGTIVVDSTPAVAALAITPLKAAAWVFGSYEVLEDTDFGQQLPRLLADAKDRLEEAAFATGNGSTTGPPGVVVGATTVYTTATTLVVALADVYGVQAALPPRFRNAPGCAWVANVALINKFRQLDTAGGASFWTNLGKGQPETLLGAPIYESTTMASALTSGNLLAIMGDFGQYIIVDRVGVSLIYEPLVKGTGGILPAGQAGWFMFWRVGAQLSSVNAFRVMKGA